MIIISISIIMIISYIMNISMIVVIIIIIILISVITITLMIIVILRGARARARAPVALGSVAALLPFGLLLARRPDPRSLITIASIVISGIMIGSSITTIIQHLLDGGKAKGGKLKIHVDMSFGF